MNITDITDIPYDKNTGKQAPNDIPPNEPQKPFGIIGTCPKCGIELHQVMGYWCPKAECPTGLGSKSTL
jgi:hypothetical protein